MSKPLRTRTKKYLMLAAALVLGLCAVRFWTEPVFPWEVSSGELQTRWPSPTFGQLSPEKRGQISREFEFEQEDTVCVLDGGRLLCPVKYDYDWDKFNVYENGGSEKGKCTEVDLLGTTTRGLCLSDGRLYYVWTDRVIRRHPKLNPIDNPIYITVWPEVHFAYLDLDTLESCQVSREEYQRAREG